MPPNKRLIPTQVAIAAYGVLCLLACCAVAGCNRHARSPRIEVNATHLDYGAITGIREARLDIPIRNRGNGVLNISHVASSCGCLVPELSAYTLPPGGEATLTLRMPPKYTVGKSRQTVSITSNDPRLPVLRITVTGRHIQPVDVTSRELLFNDIVKGVVKTNTLRVVRHDGTRPSPANIRADGPLALAILPAADQNNAANIEVTLDTRSLPLGDWHGAVVIAEEYGLTVTAKATIVGDLSYEPRTPRLRKTQEGLSAEAVLTVRSRTQKPFAITGVDGGKLALASRLSPCSERGDAYTVILSLAEEKARAGKPRLLSETVALYTDNPDQPRIDVPIMGIVGEHVINDTTSDRMQGPIQ